MKPFRSLAAPVFVAAIILGMLLPLSSARAVEEAPSFLAALRDRGYYDTADDYLARIAMTDLVNDEFKQTVPFEVAVNRVHQLKTATDPRIRTRLAREAITALKMIANANAKSRDIRAITVQLQIGELFLLIAEARIDDAVRPGAHRRTLLDEARAILADAKRQFVEAEQTIQAKRKPLETQRMEPDRSDLKYERDTLRHLWVRAEIGQCRVEYVLSKTYREGTDARATQLAKAAEAWGELADKHRTRIVGLYCRAEQGHCLVDKHDYAVALNALADIWEHDASIPQVRLIQLQALRWAMEAWIGQKKYDDAIVMRGIELDGDEKTSETGLHIRLLAAHAAQLKSQVIDGLNPPGFDRNQAIEIAKSVLADADDFPDIQQAARALLEDFGVPTKP